MSVDLRKGKTRTMLEASVDAALLAVEVYNKPRTAFRSEGYIALMIIAWTRLFHAWFYHTIGERYFYKKPNGRYVKVDGERKAWELSTCIAKYGKLAEPVRRNLEFFIKLRNKIEHRHIDRREVDVQIFGECQALLFNYENLLTHLFGPEYAINESLVYSLQFSQLRGAKQKQASRKALSRDLRDIYDYLVKYRKGLPQDVYDAQEYSIKLLYVPKVANTNRNDLAVEFVRWDALSEAEKKNVEKLTAIIKDKKVTTEAANVGKLKAGEVTAEIAQHVPEFNLYYHQCFYTVFKVRPRGRAKDPFKTDTRFCHYDEAHNDYVYQEAWPSFIIEQLSTGQITLPEIKKAFKGGEEWTIEDE